MAYSVNWLTRLITIPLSDLVWSIGNTYELALSDFHKEIRRLESDFTEGLWAPQILDHTSPKTISGVVYAAFDEVITSNEYTVQFAGNPDAVVLKGSNNNILDVYVFNGVSVAPNNSTGLQDLSTLLASAYSNEVCVSKIRGIPGTSIPIGTRKKPSNNFTQTEEIATIQGINRIRIMESMTLDSTALFQGHAFTSDNPITVYLTIEDAAAVESCTFTQIAITGVLDGNNVIRDCPVHNIVAVSGYIIESMIFGSVTVESGALLIMADCHSGVAGGDVHQTAEVNMGVDGSLRNSNYTGGLNLINYAGGGDVSMDVKGRVIVEPTCTGGDIYIRGDCWVTDNSGPGCTVHDDTDNKKINELWNRAGLDPDDVMKLGNGLYTSDLLGISVSDNLDGTFTLSRTR